MNQSLILRAMGTSMEFVSVLLILLSAATTKTTVAGSQTSFHDQRKVYIVYMGDVPGAKISPEEHHHGILKEAVGGEEAVARESRIHSYGRSFYGFAARLFPHEAARLRERRDVVSVFPSTKRKLLTTRSWDFLGFTEDRVRRIGVVNQSDIVIGVLDSGVDLGAPSFNDEGYGPPPPKWKGKCMTGPNFEGCNRKVIGARWYNAGDFNDGMDQSPYDSDGHGSHTSSTAAGSIVRGASLYGIGNGTARGGVPHARVAVYKVCGLDGCSDESILAGADDAIADGVDVISASIGGPITEMYLDSMAIAAFHAMKRGIPTVYAAGNDGPGLGQVENGAPWVFTVAATNTDRKFISKIKLGNGEMITGTSINTFLPPNRMLPLVTGTSAANATSRFNATMCENQSMRPGEVRGRVVLCFDSDATDVDVERAGGVGTIMAYDEEMDIAYSYIIPATHIDYRSSVKLQRYISSTKKPTAVILKSTEQKAEAPVLASYSSRGPQHINKHILKPDISAPGTDILAAYSKRATMSGSKPDHRHVYFNIMSGTSMATPHVAAVAAYVKTFHPEWSPAAIKSAIMTTARPVKYSRKGLENPLGSGSGLIDPVRAVHPGLVYDMCPFDYIRYLCKEGYNSTTLSLLWGRHPHLKCSDFPAPLGSDGINYPSMHHLIPVGHREVFVAFHRTVTYVGLGPSVFAAELQVPEGSGMSVTVIPSTLSFDGKHESKSFKVEVRATYRNESVGPLTAFLEWKSSKYSVRSPILLFNIRHLN